MFGEGRAALAVALCHMGLVRAGQRWLWHCVMWVCEGKAALVVALCHVGL